MCSPQPYVRFHPLTCAHVHLPHLVAQPLAHARTEALNSHESHRSTLHIHPECMGFPQPHSRLPRFNLGLEKNPVKKKFFEFVSEDLRVSFHGSLSHLLDGPSSSCTLGCTQPLGTLLEVGTVSPSTVLYCTVLYGMVLYFTRSLTPT